MGMESVHYEVAHNGAREHPRRHYGGDGESHTAWVASSVDVGDANRRTHDTSFNELPRCDAPIEPPPLLGPLSMQ